MGAVPSDTYKSSAAENSDKAALKKLATRLKVPESWLCLDGCGCWHISGPSGHVYTHSSSKGFLSGYLIVCHPEDDGRRWAQIKSMLGGTVRQDGYGEGIVLLGEKEINPPNVRKAIGCTR